MTSVCIPSQFELDENEHKMEAEVSLVHRTDGLGTVKTEKPCQQLCHRELVGAHRI